MEGNASLVEIVPPIAKWELMSELMHNEEKI
jgi:hypothetical protein